MNRALQFVLIWYALLYGHRSTIEGIQYAVFL
jgi:hypothetical protein